MAEKKLVLVVLLLCCLILLQQVNQAILEDYRVRHYQRKLLFSQIMDSTQKKCPRNAKRQRRFWVRPGRTSAWSDNFLNGVMLEEEWKENFRMSQVGFFKLCDLLRPYIEHQVTIMRTPVSVETQIAVTLYYLSDEGRLRKVANAFGLSRACCSLRSDGQVTFIRH